MKNWNLLEKEASWITVNIIVWILTEIHKSKSDTLIQDLKAQAAERAERKKREKYEDERIYEAMSVNYAPGIYEPSFHDPGNPRRNAGYGM